MEICAEIYNKEAVERAREAHEALHAGIDVGSTTVKLAVLNEQHRLIYANYERHHTDVRCATRKLLEEAQAKLGALELTFSITGSGGMGLARALDIPFVQEVIASKQAVQVLIPQTDVAIELGGEDAKIIYFDNGLEQRMNGTCAGGTGAFIDQMAALLQTDAPGLNKLAAHHTTLYPIASRCGVFAKSDVQPLLNEGVPKEDIAASIFQAVANQTVSGLACGHPIRGTVAFLGGPLNYLPELRKRFYETLNLDDKSALVPHHAHLFVAKGAALVAERDALELANKSQALEVLIDRLAHTKSLGDAISAHLDPLFATDAERAEFVARHAQERVARADLASYRGPVYMGIDAGSTTMKAALVGEAGQLLWTWYGSNRADILGCAKDVLKEARAALPSGTWIAQAVSTGYGEQLLLAALGVDSGEIETVAHVKGAEAFVPDVDFILDIGGQDMKCLTVKDGVIDQIMLNEACSAGCGSFVESFATSMGKTVEDFAREACGAKHPVDLGSRCTVFMNSRVKQAQKEGATPADVAAGLSYSVIKNALFKVIKLRDMSQVGDHVVVQGGTFMSDATLRAFELLLGKNVVRPDIAGVMGAYGAALIAKERARHAMPAADGNVYTHMLTNEQLDALEVKRIRTHCARCQNHCELTISDFGGGHRFVTGNRCEKGAAAERRRDSHAEEIPNLFAFKEKLLFGRTSLSQEEASRGTIGIPRALNMYENYPFWHTFFTKLGFRVVVSPKTSAKTYELGIESMPSESVCYPAKLSHGHVMSLLNLPDGERPDIIWMPCVRWERQEDQGATNHYNCPIVMSYPQALELNIDELASSDVQFLDPFVPYDDKNKLAHRLYDVLKEAHIQGEAPTKREVAAAVDTAWAEDLHVKEEIRAAGERVLAWLDADSSRQGIVLAGRPYHLDPEINHAIPDLLKRLGFAVLTEDSVAHLGELERPIRVVDQWMYHSRLYRAARFVATRDNLNMVQLVSFGCGLDALTADQVQEILEKSGHVHTILKIDQVSNLGAARIRLRSLKAALTERAQLKQAQQSSSQDTQTDISAAWPKMRYTKEMQEAGYTILAPQMSPIHFELVEKILQNAGYNLVLLPSVDTKAVDAGLRFVNNDICYPSILVTGQIMEAVTSGRYDMNKTAVLISQTGGGCRATNYIALIRKALADAGLAHVPVISLSVAGGLDEDNPGFNILKPHIIMQAIYSLLLGDLMMQLLYRTRPYEATPGSANALFRKHMDAIKDVLIGMNKKRFIEQARSAIADFEALELQDIARKPRVGVVGEILVKFHPTANNGLVETIEAEGCEANVPGLVDFFLFGMTGSIVRKDELGTKLSSRLANRGAIKFVEGLREELNKMLRTTSRFEPYGSIYDLADKAHEVLSLCNSMGEGWLLTAEMIELIETGTPNIVCAQPFACLPNHVVGKAVIKRLRQMHPESNIVAVDYDPGASEVNQLNRIKLMISVAKESLSEYTDVETLEGRLQEIAGERAHTNLNFNKEQLKALDDIKRRKELEEAS